MMYRHYKVAPEPLSEEARRVLAGSRDEMMNSNKGDKIMEYTKGDWKREGNKIKVLGSGTVAICPSPTTDEGVLEFVANAQLIASAPDLYEACKKLVVASDSRRPKGNIDYWVELVREAIAKVEGLTSKK